jgi:transposase
MAFREVTMIEIREVVRQWLGGRGVKAVARAMGIDPKTVRRYVRAAERVGIARCAGIDGLDDERFLALLAVLKTTAPRPESDGRKDCEAHRDFVGEKLRQGVRLTKVHRLLGRQGVFVSYSTLYRFSVEEFDFGKNAATVPVVDGKAGEEVQLDVGTITLPEPDGQGRRRRVKVFVFTPNVSRYRFVYVAEREQTDDAIRACEVAWEFYGGVFAVVLVDNAKAIIDQADPLGAKVNETFLEYAQARNFVVDTTRVRDPKGKGRVERSVRHVRDDCFAGEHINEPDGASRRARYWCEHEYGMRRHATTGRMPKEHFLSDEAARLKAAPTEPYDIPIWATPKVGRDHLAQVASALYSLPTKYIGQRLKARADSRTVRFYCHGVVVKIHERKPRGGRSVDANDFPKEKRGYAMRDVDFLQRQAAEQGEGIGMMAAALLEGPLPWTRMRQVYALLGLVRRYGAERVESACNRALRASMHNVRRLERMVQLDTPPVPEPLAKVIPLGRYLRPANQYALKRTNTEE